MKKKIITIFKSSLRDVFTKKTVKTFVYDAILYILMIFLALFFFDFVRTGVAQLSIFDNFSDQAFLQQPELLNVLTDALAKFKVYLIVSFTIFLILNYLLIAFFKMLIYSSIQKKKLGFKNFLKLFSFNLVFHTIGLFVLVSFLFFIKPAALKFIFYFVLFLVINYSALFYLYLTKTSKFKQAIKKPFTLGTKKIIIFILPYIIFLLIANMISVLFAWLNFTDILGVILLFLILIFLLQWARYFIIETIKTEDKNS